jgi:hypothetical protein
VAVVRGSMERRLAAASKQCRGHLRRATDTSRATNGMRAAAAT